MTREERITRFDALFALLNRLRGEDFGGQPECAETDPELFFPVSEADTRSIALAKEVCGRCEIREACLQSALQNGDSGVWGGTTEGERAAMRRRGDRGEPGSAEVAA